MRDLERRSWRLRFRVEHDALPDDPAAVEAGWRAFWFLTERWEALRKHPQGLSPEEWAEFGSLSAILLNGGCIEQPVPKCALCRAGKRPDLDAETGKVYMHGPEVCPDPPSPFVLRRSDMDVMSDWYVLEHADHTTEWWASITGSRQDWLELLQSMGKGERYSAYRCGAVPQGDGSWEFWSPRNSVAGEDWCKLMPQEALHFQKVALAALEADSLKLGMDTSQLSET